MELDIMNSSHPAEEHADFRVVQVNLTDAELFATNVNNIVYYSATLPVAIIGNILTLLAVIMIQRVRSCTPNLLIGVLACNDIMAVVTCHLITVASMAYGSYIGGHHICNFQSLMAFTYFKLGFLTKCCISLDRFIALTFPLKYKNIVTQKRVYAIIVHNVVFSIGSSVLTLVIDPEYIFKQPTWHMCINDFQYRTTYKLIVLILEGGMFFIGFLLFFISNATVIRIMLKLNLKSQRMFCATAKDKKQRRHSPTGIVSASAGDLNANSEHVDSKSGRRSPMTGDRKTTDSTMQNRQKKELQFAKLVTIIVSVFVVLWIPYMAVIYWEYHNETLINVFVKDIAIKLVFANCCFNPILYGLFNANYRKAYIYYIKMVAYYLSCKMCKEPPITETPWYKKKAHTYVTNVLIKNKLTPVKIAFSNASNDTDL